MKTSNKLLIAFASALILIPLLGMIYVSAVNYKTGNYQEDQARINASEKHFNTPTEYMESEAISTAFESINIEDAKQLGLYINFVEDENYGIKVPKELKDSISFRVDANGQLQIMFNMKRFSDRDYYYTTIHVYGKKMKQLSITNAKDVFLNAVSDSLKLNVKKATNINLNKDITLNSLTVTADEVKGVYVNGINVKSLSLNLIGADFRCIESSFDKLSITTAGKSEIELDGGRDKDKQYSIKNLIVNTQGEADFKIENIKVNQCAGSFSDQTKVQMPAVNLNQMYKK